VAEINSFTLPNGLRVWHVTVPGAQSLCLRLHIRSGTRYESPAVLGVSHLIEHLLCSGSGRYPSRRGLDAAIARAGGRLEAHTVSEYTMYSVKVPAENKYAAYDYLQEMVFNPLLCLDDAEMARQQVIAELKQRQDDPEVRGWDDLLKFIWPAYPHNETLETIAQITHAEAVECYRNFYRPNGMDLAIVGDVGPSEVMDTAHRWLGSIAASVKGLEKAVSPWGLAPAAQVRLVPADIGQLHLSLAFLPEAMGKSRIDDIAVRMVSEVLGNEIFNHFVYELGMAYSAGSCLYTVSDGGVVTVAVDVSPEQAVEALKRVVSTVRDFQLSKSVLEEAKASYIVDELLDLDCTEAMADFVLKQVLRYGEPLPPVAIRSLVDALDLEQVAAAAEQLFVPERAALFVLGQVDSLGEQTLTEQMQELGR
jgi:predicted Zn-dependent peptidase